MSNNRKQYEESTKLETARNQAIEAANDIGYDPVYIPILKKAETIGEINRIMRTARKEKFDSMETRVVKKTGPSNNSGSVFK